MKTLKTLLNGFRKALPAALLLCTGFAANAQVLIPFTQRTSAFSPTQTIYSINGDFTMIGNTNLTLQNYSATDVNSNNTMIKVDADGIASTNNSSASTLTFSTENGANPNCSRVLFAGLYWSGRTDATPTELQKRTIKFRGPGQAGYTSYTATSSNIRYPGSDNMYAAFVEVTSQVQQLGSGEYWAADMALTTGNGGSTGYYGGWGLVVVYENSKMQKRDVTLFDGYAYVVGGTAQWELPVSGFTSALNGAVNTKLGMMAGEGDVTITGDKFEIQKLNSSNWEFLSHGGNSATNFFNSSIFTGGNSRNPNLVNNTGMDISMFNIPNASNSVIGNGQTSTKFRYSSTQDTYIIYSICMAVDAYEPVVEGFLSTLSVNNIPTTSEDITVLPGDEIKYKVQIRNKGNEAVNNARIEIPLPYAAITYQGSLVNVFAPASSSALPYVDASLGANGTLVWDFGTLPLPSDPNTVLGEIIFTLKASEDCELYRNFNCAAPSVQIDGNISGVGANTQISVDDQPFYVGFSNVNGCSTEPLLGPFNIDINSANWVTANCPVTDGVRDFTYCNRTVAIPVTDVLGFYPAGTRFFNANQTIEYTIANPFPNQAGPITYRALLPGSSCVLSFTISITNISSVPTVADGTTEYCRNDAAVALSATPSNPSYQLFYFASSSTIAQPLLIPSTAAAGNFVYQVAEGPSSTCISTARANIPVQVNALPTITATPTQIVCFGGTGSVELAANGGTGALTFNASNPSTSNLTAGSYTYEVSDSKGCDASATAAINAAPAQPAQPSLACYQTANWDVASCSWIVSGTMPAQPAIACYETATFNTLTCGWDVTGTQAPAPTNLSCWQTATFNTTSCDWDVTGTQTPAPTNLSCWQTATFNTTSCDWDVTGTQAPAPTNLSCWQTATFNTTSCDWDVTGTQAPAPTNLSCWQTATFNTTSCSWDVTGTQAPAPTNLSCWQTATFNTTSCDWDVTGTQAPAPTNLSCWQTAAFNTTSCDWDVTGTQTPAPTNLSCWQTATFNTTSCSWDVTGTQTPAPTNLSCWQTATFNTTSCDWDVTGTQEPAPTNLSCWETATFNTTSCDWDVTGTQPEQPTNLACYQTATFNTANCSWVVSGTPAPATVTNASACGTYTWAVNNQEYSVSGTYNFSVNCQDYTLVLSITPITNNSASITACDSYTWPVNGQTYTQSGTYTFLDGCVNRSLQLTISGATTAGQISGPANSCAHQGTSGTNATYSVQATNASSYLWTIPSGATNISGQGTASISFRFSSTFSSGNVSVLVSGCGTPITRSISVTRTAPATPGAITGTVNVCAFRGTNTPVTYSIAAVSNAASYTWTLPSGVTLVSGSGTTTIQVLIGSTFCGGNITVRANSACGNSSTSCLALSVSTPSSPASISGLTTACPGNVQTYSTAAVNNATSYQWTMPTGALITSGAGTNTISVSFGSSFCGGNLSVRAVNGCGQSSARSITINRNVPATPAAINGPTTNLCGTGTYTYSIAAVSGATSYTWTVPTGTSIVSNNGTSITLNFTNNFSSGSITVRAVNACGSGTARSITLSRLPSTPASITGPSTVCRNQQGVVFTTPVVSGLTYTWTVPSGAVITAGQGTGSVTVKFGNSNGNVTVKANNGCGSSSTRSLAVCVASCRMGETEPEPEEAITETLSKFEAYPNPGIGLVNISIPELDENIQLRVIAANGTLVRYEQIPAGTRNWTIQLDSEADGVYMIQIQTLTQVKQLRYIKQ